MHQLQYLEKLIKKINKNEKYQRKFWTVDKVWTEKELDLIWTKTMNRIKV